MTTDTLTPAVETTTAPAATGNTYSVVGLVLSILSVPLSIPPLAVAGIVLGFVARRKEPAAVTTANWAIIVGFVSLFGWVLVGIGVSLLALPWALGAWSLTGFAGL
jgi:hypothetical protein